MCLIQASSLTNLNQTNLNVSGISANGNAVSISGKSGQLCSDANTACSPAVLQNAGFNQTQAITMSCIAMTESTGNPNSPDSSTGACGLFQITNKTSGSNWQNPKYHTGSCSTASSCNDPVCNTQTAQIMFRNRDISRGRGYVKTGRMRCCCIRTIMELGSTNMRKPI